MSKRNYYDAQYERQGVKDQKVDDVRSFRLKRTQDYEGAFPVYKQPQEVTSYSIDHERHVWFDNREMVKKKRHVFLLKLYIFFFIMIRNIIIHLQVKI